MQKEQTIWDHVEDLRNMLFRSFAVIIPLVILFFVAMPTLFDTVILAPCSSDFILYRWLCMASNSLPFLPDFCADTFGVELTNIRLASQFLIHTTTSLWLGLVFAFPFIIYQVWRFIAPALYENEKRNVRFAFLLANIQFFLGILVAYIVVFPLTLRFLVEYQISATIVNQLTLDSYMSNFLSILFLMGLVFELPLLCWMLSGMGLLKKSFFATYRRHAIAACLVVSAIITPSGDPFTLIVVFLPVYMLYELSALFVKKDTLKV